MEGRLKPANDPNQHRCFPVPRYRRYERSVGDWISLVSESRRWKEAYGLLSSSSHIFDASPVVASHSVFQIQFQGRD